MSPAQLLEHFDRISEAPDAVVRLRRFILDLAVRGKLVEQDPNDEPAAELLKRIQVEKARKKGKPDIETTPYAAPSGWEWVCLGMIAQKLTDGSHNPPKNAETGFPMLSSKNVLDGSISFSNPTRYLSEEDFAAEDTRTHIEPDDILLTIVGSIGRSAVVPKNAPRFAVQRSVAVVRTRLHSGFLSLQFRGTYAQEYFDEHGKGTAQKGIYLGKLSLAPIAVPPLAEQHRIVAKVDELMALCDQLETATNERDARRDRLVAASLNRIVTAPVAADEASTQAPSATSLRDAARFHLDHFPRLTTRPEHIKQLRQTILNLAVRGALSESAAWAAKSLPLKSAASLQNGYAFKSEWFSKTGIRLLRNTNVSHGVLRWDDLACLPLERTVEFERFQLSEGDVVLSLDRPFIVTGTKVARVCAGDLPCLLLQRVGRFQLDPNLLSPDYLFLWIQSPHFTKQIDPGRSNGVPHISSKQVESALIFLPPLAEQHRIVAKTAELMALCDQLEAQLNATQNDSRHLLEAVLHEALAPALEKAA